MVLVLGSPCASVTERVPGASLVSSGGWQEGREDLMGALKDLGALAPSPLAGLIGPSGAWVSGWDLPRGKGEV